MLAPPSPPTFPRIRVLVLRALCAVGGRVLLGRGWKADLPGRRGVRQKTAVSWTPPFPPSSVDDVIFCLLFSLSFRQICQFVSFSPQMGRCVRQVGSIHRLAPSPLPITLSVHCLFLPEQDERLQYLSVCVSFLCLWLLHTLLDFNHSKICCNSDHVLPWGRAAIFLELCKY